MKTAATAGVSFTFRRLDEASQETGSLATSAEDGSTRSAPRAFAKKATSAATRGSNVFQSEVSSFEFFVTYLVYLFKTFEIQKSILFSYPSCLASSDDSAHLEPITLVFRVHSTKAFKRGTYDKGHANARTLALS
jgi:hypothetical protein